ncbi:MAG TPA: hypothetical protein PKD18_09260 [Saprospiraceae bacterium]|nr:hypothetical protein [Saprospiraceae bacterium]
MKSILFFLVPMLIFVGCSTSKVKTYADPTLTTGNIKSVALFPLRNSFAQTTASLSTGDIMEINKMFQSEFINKNPNAKILNAVESRDLLNDKNLVSDYDKLLEVFDNTGIPDTRNLQNIGSQLNVDAIAQGFLVRVVQNDGQYGKINGETTIKVKYVMFSTKDGSILWEVIADGSKVKSTLAKAPEVSEVIEILRKKLANSVPKLM